MVTQKLSFRQFTNQVKQRTTVKTSRASFTLDIGHLHTSKPSMLLELFAKSNLWKHPLLCQFNCLFPFTFYQFWNSGLQLQQTLVTSVLWACA